MIRQKIVQRLLYLRNWEFLNTFLLPIYLFINLVSFNIENWEPYAFSMFIICVILAEGTFYWHLKLQTIYKNKIALPPYFNRVFSAFKWTNMLLLLIYPVMIIFSQMTLFINFQVSFWSNTIFIIAILEHINYFYYQLSHDNLNDINYLIKHKKVRRSPIYIDLQKNQERVLKQTAD